MANLWKYLLCVALLGAVASSATAGEKRGTLQEPGVDDIDEEEDDISRLPGEDTRAGRRPDEPVVEVARGIFVQTDPGAFDYLGLVETVPGHPNPSFGAGIFWGHSMRIHVGSDILTGNLFGLSAQVTFWQTVNNGAGQEYGYLTQGDTRSFLFEVAVRPTLLLGSVKRVNLYVRGGAGVGFLQQAVSPEQLPVDGIYSSLRYGLNPKPFVSGGAGLEYYTRLSHFSFTLAEVDLLYLPGLDYALAINFAGFKYTF